MYHSHSGVEAYMKIVIQITCSLLMLAAGSMSIFAVSGGTTVNSTDITFNKGDSYFTVDGQKRFLFGRNPTGKEQR